MAVLVSVSATRVSMLLRLRSRLCLRRRSLRTRLRCGPILKVLLLRLRLRTILYARSFHPLLRLWLRPVLHPGLRLR